MGSGSGLGMGVTRSNVAQQPGSPVIHLGTTVASR